jgi:small subunit ribosomal protein S20
MAEEKKAKKRPTEKKRIIQSKKRQLRNKSFKSKTKTAIIDFKKSLKNKEEGIKDKIKTVFSLMDKGVKKKIFKKNKANRIKSKMALFFKKNS